VNIYIKLIRGERMNNADMPINALVATDALARSMRYEGIEDTIKSLGGLTKRECFAVMAMQGLLSNGTRALVASESVDIADALLKELNK